MKLSLRLELLFIPVLALTLAWKLVPTSEKQQQDTGTAISRFLTQHGFHVAVDARIVNGMHVLAANSANCRMLIAKIWPLKDSINEIQYLASPTYRGFVVFRGTAYENQPVLRTALAYFWFRLTNLLSKANEMSSVLGVVTSCDTRRLPWIELASI